MMSLVRWALVSVMFLFMGVFFFRGMNRYGAWLLGGLVIAVALAFSVPAHAHDRWANGEPVPAWVAHRCCGINDVHHLKPEQVHRVDGGYLVDGHDGVIPLSQTDPSQDGDYWLFGVTVWTDNVQTIGDVRCFFIPLSY